MGLNSDKTSKVFCINTIIMVHNGTDSLCRLLNCIGLRSSLVQLSIFQAPPYFCYLQCYIYL